MGASEGAQRVIRTPDQRVRVFVSSTLGELADERAAVREVIDRLRLTPVMFELGARPHPARALYRTYLQQSHVFVGMYWQSYGWVAPDEGVSGLEDEYILSSGLPRLLYVKEPAPAREDRLADLLGRIKGDDTSTYKKFTTTDQLRALLADDLMVLLTESFESATARGRRTESRLRVQPPPEPATPLIGRDDDIEAVTRLVEGGARLVSLTGSGGIGKTRLALEVARRLRTAFADGVHFVSLASTRASEEVLLQLATSLELPLDSSRGLLETLTRHLAPCRLLLVMDNFEHLADAAGDVAALLGRCPSLTVLVTSRHLLRLRGEREHRVGPLAVPAPRSSPEEISRSPAVQLFVDRARAVQPGFDLTAGNAAAVAGICARLDGVPLAIELAAGRVRLLAPAVLLTRLSSRLDLLAGGPVDLPDRQRTLRATIDWSYQLLSDHERALYARLSVFVGGFVLDAVEPVCGSAELDVLDTVTSLLDKSLVVAPTGSREGEPRLHMLSTVRDHAAERLREGGEAAHYRQRHADHFLRLVEDYRSGLAVTADEGMSARLDAEAGNLHAAVQWWQERGDRSSLARFAWATFPHYWLRGQLREFDEMVLSADTGTDGLDPDDAFLVVVQGFVHVERGRSEQADAAANRALGSLPEEGPTSTAALVLKAYVMMALDRTTQAEEYAERGLRAARTAGDPWLTAVAARARGVACLEAGDLNEAQASFLECLEYARAAQHWPLMGAALGPLGSIEMRHGNRRSAWDHFREAAECYRRGRSREGLPFLLEEVAAMTVPADPRSAAEMLSVAQVLRSEMGIVVPHSLRERVAALRERVRAVLGDEFDPAWRAGSTLQAAVALDRAFHRSPDSQGASGP